MNTTQHLVLAAAAGLALAVSSCKRSSDEPEKEGSRTATTDSGSTASSAGKAKARGKDCCMGLNDCKGKGGCAVPESHDCAGQNDCKGQGGCNMHCPK